MDVIMRQPRIMISDVAGLGAAAQRALVEEGYDLVETPAGCIPARLDERLYDGLIVAAVGEGDGTAREALALARRLCIPVVATLPADCDFSFATVIDADDFLLLPLGREEPLRTVKSVLSLRDAPPQFLERQAQVRDLKLQLWRVRAAHRNAVSVGAHDLQGMLGAVDMNAQMLLRDPALPETTQSRVATLREQLGMLSRLMMSRTDLSRAALGALKPNRSTTELHEVVATALHRCRSRAVANQVVLTQVGGALPLPADPELLGRALEHLVDEAVRAADPGAEIVCSARRLDDGMVAIEVAASERSVPQGYRGPPAQEPQRRLQRGFAQTFCELVAAAHGGTLRIEATGHGQCVCIQLPDDAEERDRGDVREQVATRAD
jgi:signal transduction histidine kinase